MGCDLRKDYEHLNLSDEAHNILLDWHYKAGCDIDLMEEAEIINTKKKILVMPDKKTRCKKISVVKK